ncbi:tetratricopeptide repeat protein [Aphanizomenon flos-aquae]|uniref:tetratricopeptide repeat protein n=1 Tax=Aphanizomenon flos-aquae TaxID=1176 RepID=UPI001F552B7C|nr:tetratricopeptide repeat protein [Aphanizomenon flos-aquae]
MITLHLDLKAVAGNYVELRYFTDNYNQYERRTLPLSEITDLIELAERDYYVSSFAEDYAVTGLRLYNLLDGSDRWLQRLINQYQRQGIILAIATAEKLAHLPWEVLHDDTSFLVERSIIPVRWVSSDSVNTLSVEKNPENRALQVLFMATSPQGVEPVLDFEAEEGRILEATGRQPFALTVEESGCLSELVYLVADYGKDYFDIFHITGHATITNGQPEFITETETGEAFYASAEHFKQALQFRLPKLIFLSGCRTGQAGGDGANYGSVPSMAEELLQAGAKAVLGWGQKVLESDATEAAATLYKELAAGKQITEAVARTYQTLIKNQARDWHLLRLYAADSLPGELVTPKGTPKRKLPPPLSVSTKFLDPATQKIKVPTRESFVGRRRQLQSCLRTLTQSTEEIGVLIHGMGGLGKSSVASRLCDRLPNFQRVVLVGRIDEPSLVSRLVDKLDDDEQRKQLQNPDEELRFRFKRVFQQLSEAGEKPFLLVLDDFEVNLELTSPPTPLLQGEGSLVPPFPRREGGLGGLGRLQPTAVEVLTALVWAIRETYTNHRLILTCRYDFEFSQLRYFYKQPLEGMRGADLRKKCSRLVAFGAKSEVDEALKSQARRLADGNPRLLEWLDKILQNSTVDQVAILDRLEVDAVELREQVLAEALLQQMDETMGEMLSQGLVFELPVPREALTAVCENIPNLADYINRAVALGLLEVSPDESLRVPRILPLTLPTHVETLHQQAAEVLYRLWRGDTKTTPEEQQLEIHRLALFGKQGEIASTVGSDLTTYWNQKSRFRETIYLCKSTLDIVESDKILFNLARAEQEIGEIEQADQHYQQALELCSATDEEAKATIIHNQASTYLDKGEIDEAITLYYRSLEINERTENSYNQAAIFHELGRCYSKKREFDKALSLYQKSLEIKECIGDVINKSSTLQCLGTVYARKGDRDKALFYFYQALQIEEEFGNETGKGKASILMQMGQLAYSEKDFVTARKYLQKSFEIFQQIESPNAEKVKEIINRIEN